MDPFEGDFTAPVTLHRFPYALDNPVDVRDPSGQDSLVESLGSFSVSQVIQAFAILSLATVCTVNILAQHGPGICGSSAKPKILRPSSCAISLNALLLDETHHKNPTLIPRQTLHKLEERCTFLDIFHAGIFGIFRNGIPWLARSRSPAIDDAMRRE
jgi:hypothetical protein